MSFKQFLVNENHKNTYDYSSLMFELPEDLTDSIISWGFDHIPNESIFLDKKQPSFGREDDVHVTLIYGIHTDDYEDVHHLFSKEKPFECKLGKMSLFKKNDKFDVLVIDVDCENLHELNSKMRRQIDATETHPQYIPHVTICYLKKGTGEQYIEDKSFLDEKFECDKVIFSSKNGKKTTIKLGEKNEKRLDRTL
jgi:2'-5' RNA ligase